jgi:hypothetical protein
MSDLPVPLLVDVIFWPALNSCEAERPGSVLELSRSGAVLARFTICAIFALAAHEGGHPGHHRSRQ